MEARGPKSGLFFCRSDVIYAPTRQYTAIFRYDCSPGSPDSPDEPSLMRFALCIHDKVAVNALHLTVWPPGCVMPTSESAAVNPGVKATHLLKLIGSPLNFCLVQLQSLNCLLFEREGGVVVLLGGVG